MAAFDIIAQVAHVALRPDKMRLQDARWQVAEWTEKLAGRDEALADLARNEYEGEPVVTILQEVRNRIHREAL